MYTSILTAADRWHVGPCSVSLTGDIEDKSWMWIRMNIASSTRVCPDGKVRGVTCGAGIINWVEDDSHIGHWGANTTIHGWKWEQTGMFRRIVYVSFMKQDGLLKQGRSSSYWSIWNYVLVSKASSTTNGSDGWGSNTY